MVTVTTETLEVGANVRSQIFGDSKMSSIELEPMSVTNESLQQTSEVEGE